MTASPPVRFWLPLGVVLAVALSVRLGYVLAVTRSEPLGLDADSYRQLGLGIRDGLGYVGPPGPDGVRHATATFPPGFPAFVAVVSLTGRGLLHLRLALALVGTVNVVLLALVARRVAGPLVALAAAAIAAVYLPLVTTDGSVMSEPLYLTGVLLAVLAALRLHDRPGLASASLFGAAVGATALVRSEGLLLLAFVGLPAVLLRTPRSRWRALLALGLAAVVAVAALVPWHLRNQRVFGEPVWFSGNSATAVAGANCDRHVEGSEAGLWTFGCLALPGGAGAFDDEAALYAALRTKAREYATDHLGDLPALTVIRELRTWGLYAPRQQARFEAPEGRVYGWQLAAWASWLAVLALAVAGAAVLRSRRAALWPLAGLLALVVTSTALTYGNQRFRIAAEPAVIILAAGALAWAVERVSAGGAHEDR